MFERFQFPRFYPGSLISRSTCERHIPRLKISKEVSGALFLHNPKNTLEYITCVNNTESDKRTRINWNRPCNVLLHCTTDYRTSLFRKTTKAKSAAVFSRSEHRKISCGETNINLRCTFLQSQIISRDQSICKETNIPNVFSG